MTEWQLFEPGTIPVWAWDTDGYRALIEQAGFEVVRHKQDGFFQVIMGVRP